MKLEVLDPQGLVFLIHDFLSPQECRAYIAKSEALGFTPAPLTTRSGPVMAPEVRNNTRVMVDDQALAQSLWKRLGPWLPERLVDWHDHTCEAVGLNERFRFFRYDPQQRFARHYDGTYQRDNG